MNTKNIMVMVSVFIVIIIIAMCIGIILSSQNGQVSENNDIPVDINISDNVKIKNKTIKIQNSTKSVDINYPEIQNLEEGYTEYINSKIYNEINENKVYNDRVEGLESGEIGTFTYEADYTRYNCDNYVSLVIEQYIHLGDGRPRTQKKCYVIDANNNSTVALVDVVANKTGYKAAIVNEINNQAKASGIELIGGNGLNNINNNQAFYIKDDKLVIYFEASEIAATAVGELEFVMPFELVDNKFVI